MRTKLVAAFLLALGLALIPAAVASAASDHSEVTDGCDHGDTSKPCVPDPSVNGKDCLEHGNHGGVNEDHCTTDTTSSPSSSTTTTTEPAVTTTTTAPVVEVTTTTTAPAVTTTTTEAETEPALLVAVDPAPVAAPGPVAVPAVPEGPAPSTDVLGVTFDSGPAPVVPAAPAAVELAHTGSGVGALGLFGLALLLVGVGVQLLVRPLAVR